RQAGAANAGDLGRAGPDHSVEPCAGAAWRHTRACAAGQGAYGADGVGIRSEPPAQRLSRSLTMSAAPLASSSHGSVTALGQHGLRSREKLARIPVKIVPPERGDVLPKPPWLRARPMMSETVAGMASILREHKLHSVCEEAMCPNIGECFAQRTATFMIM